MFSRIGEEHFNRLIGKCNRILSQNNGLHCQFNQWQMVIIVFSIYTHIVFLLKKIFYQTFTTHKLQFSFLEDFKSKVSLKVIWLVSCKHTWDQERSIQSSLLFLHLNVRVLSLYVSISYIIFHIKSFIAC